MRSLRNLVVVLGDQLDARAAFDSFFAETDAVWMVEVEQESTHVCSCKQRIAVFLSAMRHFRDTLRDTGSGSGYRVHYTELDACTSIGSRQDLLRTDLETLRPEKVVATQPGEWRVMDNLQRVCKETGTSARQSYAGGPFSGTGPFFRTFRFVGVLLLAFHPCSGVG